MRALLMLVALGTLGCGPIQASTAISDGTNAVEEARRQGAEKYARYEFVKAIALLEEAKLKNGYGEFEIARQYAEQATELGREAGRTAARRRDLELRRLRGRRNQRNEQRPLVPPPNPGEGSPQAPQTSPPGTTPPPAVAPPPRERRQILAPSMQPTPPAGDDG